MRDSSPKFLVDHNLSPQVAEVLRIVGLHAKHLTELGFPQDTPDDVWLEAIGKEGRCLISRDLGIRKNPRLIAALKKHRVGAFFLGGKQRSSRELVEQVVTANRIIEAKAMSARKPFAFIVRPGGRQLVALPLD